MGCGSSKDPKPPAPAKQDGTGSQPPPAKFEPFTDFPTPKLLAKAQRDYTAPNQPHNDKLAYPDIQQDIPAPYPPPTRKAQVFKKDDYKQWDERVLDAPDDLVFGPIKSLVDYLVQGAKNDIAKVRAFYVWIACARAENYDLDQTFPPDSALHTLLLVRAQRYEYNRLFQTMCKCANLPCILVNRGGVKGASFKHGEPVARGNMWCLVYVDKSWRLVDQHFGSFYVSKDDSDWDLIDSNLGGYKASKRDDQIYFHMNESYFLTDPEQFIYDHFTAAPGMQLLGRPVTEDEFINMARLRSPYFDYGIVDLSEPRCKIINETGEVTLSFVTKPDSYLVFKYAIFKHVGTKAKANVDGEKLTDFAMFENNGDTKSLRVRFKHIGLYKIDIMIIDVKANSNSWYWLADYVVRCNRPYFNLKPMPPVPASLQELGPGAHWKLLEIEAMQQGGVIEAIDGYAQLNLRQNDDHDVEYMFQLESQKISLETLRKCHIQDIQSQTTSLHMKLPADGNYLLKSFTRRDRDSPYTNTCNYLVTSHTKYIADLFPQELSGRAGAIGEGKQLLKPISHPQAVFDAPSDGDVELTMQMLVTMDIEVTLMMYDNASVKDTSEYLWYGKEGDTLRCCLRFPEAGTYKMLIKTKPTGGKLKESWRYLIDVEEPTEDCTPFPTAFSDWSRNFKLISPNRKILPENTEVPFEVQIQGTVQVFLMQDGKPVNLQKENGFSFKGLINTQQDQADLFLFAHFVNRTMSNEVLHFEVLSAEAIEQLDKRQRSRRDAAIRRRDQQEKEKEKERVRAEKRKKAAEEKAKQEEEEFERNKEELFAEEKRLEKEALEEHARAVKQREQELELLQKTPENTDDIIKNEVEDAKKEQNAETARRRQQFSDMQKVLIRERLREATKFRQKEKLEDSLEQFEQAGLKEENLDLTDARRILGMLHAKEKLLEAMEGTDVDALYQAIDDTCLQGYEKDLMYELGEAGKLAAKLERMKRKRYRVLDMNNSTMMELRGYQRPSKEVHEVIQATLLLLGENEDRTKDWKDCQRMFKTTGDKSIMRAIQSFDLEHVDPEIAARVKKILDRNDRSRVRSHSAGAATMFIWASGILDELDDISDSPARVERQKEILNQPDVDPLTPKQWATKELKPNKGPNRL